MADETMAEAQANLAQVRKDDPYPERTECHFEGCGLSAEEHHRINAGLRLEIAGLKAQLAKRPVSQDKDQMADRLRALLADLED